MKSVFTIDCCLPNQITDMSNHKTQLCIHFKNAGTCLYGDKCNFAHGKGELRKHAPKPVPKIAPKPKITKPVAKPVPKTNLFAGFSDSDTEPDTEPETVAETTSLAEPKFSWADEMENDFTFMNTKSLCSQTLPQ